MPARLITKLALACVALTLVPASALAAEEPVEIKRFDISRYQTSPSDPEYTQAGGHPNVNIYMQFCEDGAPISDIEVVPGGLRVTTATPHGHPGTFIRQVRIIGVKGILSANRSFTVGTFQIISPTEFTVSAPVDPADTAYVPNTGQVFIPGNEYGCNAVQRSAFLKDFTLKLPPGFLGNPTAVDPCPTHLWLAGSCPDNTKLGHAVADTIPSNGFFMVPTAVYNLQTLGWEPARLGTEVVPGIPPGPLPNTVTLRTAPDPEEIDEPNQQGADQYEGDQGDYGINSYQVNIPKELGGNVGKVRAIDIVLCAQVPCQVPELTRNVPQTAKPVGDTRPFFVNPTSCGTKTVRLESRSYSPPGERQTVTVNGASAYTLTFGGDETTALEPDAFASEVQAALEALPSIGEGNVSVGGVFGFQSAGPYRVRFRGALSAVDVPELVASDPAVTVVTTHPGGKDESFEDFVEEDLLVEGCEEDDPTTPATDETTPPFDIDLNVTPDDASPGASNRQTISIDYPPYTDAPIWQAQLKDADTILPPGMGLAPGGGNGLQACSYAQFGVSGSAPHKQLDNNPVQCPGGSHVGDIEVETPVLPVPIGGRAFFGPTGAPGRPTAGNPWKLFLLLEGQGVRIKLVGDVTLSPSGQVRTVFVDNPETPFTHFRLKMGTAQRAVLMTPIACGTHVGGGSMTAWSGAVKPISPSITPLNCNPDTPFQVNIDSASASPDQAGSHSVSRIVLSRPDGNDMLSGLKLSLPPGAAGSLSAVPKCPLGQAQAGSCPESTLVGNIKTTLGSGISLFTVPGKLYLAEAAAPGDVASIVATVPAKAGVPTAGKYPIDLGPDVVIINRLLLREDDVGVDVILGGAYQGGHRISDGIPTMLQGVPLPIRQIDITVDRDGFFLNPTGCDPRTLTGTFTSAGGKQSVASMQLQATGCDRVPFDPTLYMIVGERGKTRAGQNVHPPLTAIVTQKAGEAAISRARVLVPDIVRPNVPFLNEPNALCNDAQAAARACPEKSNVGSARVITPVLPFELNGPVHIVQEIGSILPKLYLYLRGGGFEVVLKARNRILGVRTENTFDFVPDVPQSYFELKIHGGTDGLLNNFFDLCDTPASSRSRQVEATFNGHNGTVKNSKFPVRVEGCGSTIAAARVARNRIIVRRNGVAKTRVRCRRNDQRCRGRLVVRGKGIRAAKNFRIPRRKTRTVRLKFSRKEVRRLRKAKRMRGRAIATVGGFGSSRRNVTIVFRR